MIDEPSTTPGMIDAPADPRELPHLVQATACRPELRQYTLARPRIHALLPWTPFHCLASLARCLRAGVILTIVACYL